MALRLNASPHAPFRRRALHGLSLAAAMALSSCLDPFHSEPRVAEDPARNELLMSLALACNATVWKSGTQYPAGAIVVFTDGKYYIAEHANPGYNPTVSTWYWDPYACGGTSTGGTGTTPTGSCQAPDWATGRNYAAGDVVRYPKDGKFYVAEHANPGYDPTISTWFWEPKDCSAGTGGMGGTGGTGDTGGTGPTLTWKAAHLTWYTSWPEPGSEECVVYNGCTWAGYFAALDGQQSREWVAANNIAAVHEKDFAKYKLKTLRLKQGTRQIDVKVYDMCSDKDCDGCCTRNAGTAGFLIDIESHTADRFGTRSGTVGWTCLDCQ